jgi:hypothetical protein
MWARPVSRSAWLCSYFSPSPEAGLGHLRWRGDEGGPRAVGRPRRQRRTGRANGPGRVPRPGTVVTPDTREPGRASARCWIRRRCTRPADSSARRGRPAVQGARQIPGPQVPVPPQALVRCPCRRRPAAAPVAGGVRTGQRRAGPGPGRREAPTSQGRTPPALVGYRLLPAVASRYRPCHPVIAYHPGSRPGPGTSRRPVKAYPLAKAYRHAKAYRYAKARGTGVRRRPAAPCRRAMRKDQLSPGHGVTACRPARACRPASACRQVTPCAPAVPCHRPASRLIPLAPVKQLPARGAEPDGLRVVPATPRQAASAPGRPDRQGPAHLGRDRPGRDHPGREPRGPLVPRARAPLVPLSSLTAGTRMSSERQTTRSGR